jgi:D-alanyl-D-alanine carboxypeptidase
VRERPAGTNTSDDAGSVLPVMRGQLSRRLPRAVTAGAMAVLLSITVVGSATAESKKDPRSERSRVRAERAKKLGAIDSLKATQSDLEQNLAQLSDDIAAQQQDVADARRELEAAEQSVLDAQAAEAEKQAEVEATGLALDGLVLETFVQGASGDALGLSALTGDPNDGLRYGLSQITTLQMSDSVDRLMAARDDLELAKAAATEAQQAAADQRASQEQQLADLESALEAKEKVAADVDDSIERAIGEAAYLADLDANLSAQIAAEQKALLERLAKARANSPARPTRAPAGRATGPQVSTDGVDVALAGNGIMVNVQIVDQVSRLLNDAGGAGINLGGHGYRSSAGQIATRRANCGSSDYDIYEKPASACRPPTARPGRSMHERGLAIDFTCDGSLISSRSNPCYRWLANNAASYGLYNLPSEPWHWSTNGN